MKQHDLLTKKEAKRFLEKLEKGLKKTKRKKKGVKR